MQENKNEKYYSNGKLLITGEYAVLDGALALALPIKFGQSLEVDDTWDQEIFRWEAYVQNKLWFFAEYNIEHLSLIKTNITDVSERLKKIIKSIIEVNPKFKEKLKTRVITKANFNKDWGLGTSSTLISNIAYWAKTNPYNILRIVSNGSGYDIAAAREELPFLYKNKKDKEHLIKSVNINNLLKDNIYFIYLGKKQDSENSIISYKKKNNLSDTIIKDISTISKNIAFSKDIDTFNKALFNHEEIIGHLIGNTPIQQQKFPDFYGQIKSLGAWGGDFILASTQNDDEYVKQYFNSKKLNTIFSYNDIIIK